MPDTDNVANPATSVRNEADIARVSVKIPPIWKKNIKVWFLQVEAQFTTLGITNETTKFNHVVASLEADVVELISDF